MCWSRKAARLLSSRPCQVEHRCSSRLFGADGSLDRHSICDQTISLDGFYTRQDYPELLRRIRFKDPESGKTGWSSITEQLLASGSHHLRALQTPLAGGTLLRVPRSSSIFGASSSTARRRCPVTPTQAAHLWIAVPAPIGATSSSRKLASNIKRHDRVEPGECWLRSTLSSKSDILCSVTLFEKMPIHQAFAGDENRCNASQITNQLNLFDF